MIARIVSGEDALAWRHNSGLTQDGAAERLGVSKSTYRNFERGRTNKLQGEAMTKLVALVTADQEARVAPMNEGDSAKAHEHLVNMVVAELRMLADFLEDPNLPKEIKARRFQSLVKSYSEALPDYVNFIRRG